MALTQGLIQPATLVSEAGDRIDTVVTAGIRRLAVDAIIGAGGIFATGAFDSGAEDETQSTVLVRSAVTALDGSQAVGNRNVPVEARLYSADTDMAMDLYGLTTNARLAAKRGGSASSLRIEADTVGAIGSATSNPVGLYTLAILAGRDSTGAQAIRPVEVRDYSAAADVASTLTAALVNARLAVVGQTNDFGTDFGRLAGVYADSGASAIYLNTVQARESAYTASKVGRRFYYTHQTIDTKITGQTSFVATTPTFMLSNTSASRLVVRSITLIQAGTVAGGAITYAVQINTTDDFSSGGTAVTAANPNEESAATPAAGITFRTNPTATGAAGRVLVQGEVVASVGSAPIQINFADGVLLGPTSASMSVYTFAGTTGPSWYFVFEVEIVG